ncbi:MAG: YlzJ-like family protein [Alicyclobacillus sp.]|nr:YlzJ-like family protein [Alicyclobacillus sp.]
MMLLWTIVPVDAVMDDPSAPSPEYQEITREGVTMLVTPMENGYGRLERLVSPRPQDYLRPEWQPGAMIPLF